MKIKKKKQTPHSKEIKNVKKLRLQDAKSKYKWWEKGEYEDRSGRPRL